MSCGLSVVSLDFYPRPPRGGRQICGKLPAASRSISIHALREEGDCCWVYPLIDLKYFYPRPPRGGRLQPIRLCQMMRYFYPRPPRGGRPDHHKDDSQPFRISIHALREEGDSRPCRCNGAPGYFYPLPPRGGRPRASARRKRSGRISIHALREEGD